MTNFTAPLTVNGTPVGMGGLLPFSGNVWYVNETTGSDGNQGTAQFPLQSLAQAQINAVANNGDVVLVYGTIHTTQTVPWAKAGVHLIGLTASSNNNRARISAKGATPFSPLVNVTAEGCIFANLATFHGGFTSPTGSQVCWNDAGGRNQYSGVQFLGGGDTVAAALAGMRSLTVGGDGENQFVGCTIGLDTIVRATNANASLEFLNGSARNVFRDCVFQSECTDAADVHVLVQAGGMDRYAFFKGCMFQNFGGTSLTAAMSNAGGSPGGNLIVAPDCISVGASAIAASGNVYVGQISAAGATTTGIGILAT